jgi:hypothetical protein
MASDLGRPKRLLLFERNDDYVTQRALFVASESPDVTPSSVREAVGFMFGEGKGLPAEELRHAVTSLAVNLEPGGYIIEERRSAFEWGASGPELYEIMATLAFGVTTNALWDGVKSGMGALVRRIRDIRETSGYITSPPTAENVASSFGDFARRAFRAKSVEIIAIESIPEGWALGATADGAPIAGIVTEKGDLLRAWRLPPGGGAEEGSQ